MTPGSVRTRSSLPEIAAAVIVAAAALAGCAGGASHGWSSAARLSEGRLVALRSCGGCHAFGATGDSRDPLAPPLRTLATRFSPGVLRERLDVVTEHGHVNMPPIYISPQERRALIAYLRSIAAADTDSATKT